jgi:flagellar biosynthesis chaperone FliJ
MKNLLLITLLLTISIQFSLFAQDPSSDRWVDNGDDTQITIPSSGGKIQIDKNFIYDWEDILKIRVTDAPNDFFKIRNATGLNSKFVPWILGSNQTDSRVSLFISGVTNYAYDTGSEPLIIFDARKYTDTDNLINGTSISNRSLFDWRSYTTSYMRMNANGYLGIGTSLPQAQLHTTGTVRFQGLSSAIGNYIVMADYSGNISRYSLPSSSLMAFATSSPTLNSLPRFNASNVLVSSQIYDDGTNIGIGGSPATNAKVTVYGVVNTLSDAREKTNITHLENALDKIEALNGYNYNWKNSDEKQIGLIAQEVEKVIPEAVSENQQGTKFLNYDGIIPVLTEAIKEQQKYITKQNLQISKLENELQEIKKMLGEIVKKLN